MAILGLRPRNDIPHISNCISNCFDDCWRWYLKAAFFGGYHRKPSNRVRILPETSWQPLRTEHLTIPTLWYHGTVALIRVAAQDKPLTLFWLFSESSRPTISIEGLWFFVCYLINSLGHTQWDSPSPQSFLSACRCRQFCCLLTCLQVTNRRPSCPHLARMTKQVLTIRLHICSLQNTPLDKHNQLYTCSICYPFTIW